MSDPAISQPLHDDEAAPYDWDQLRLLVVFGLFFIFTASFIAANLLYNLTERWFALSLAGMALVPYSWCIWALFREVVVVWNGLTPRRLRIAERFVWIVPALLGGFLFGGCVSMANTLTDLINRS